MYPHTIVLDFDGTLVRNAWPAIGAWLPGATSACKMMRNAGIHLIVNSCRTAPIGPDGTRRTYWEQRDELDAVRAVLDEAGLDWLPIHTSPWKPSASAYVDDKAWTYPPSPWTRGSVNEEEAWLLLAHSLVEQFGEPTCEYPPLVNGVRVDAS